MQHESKITSYNIEVYVNVEIPIINYFFHFSRILIYKRFTLSSLTLIIYIVVIFCKFLKMNKKIIMMINNKLHK